MDNEMFGFILISVITIGFFVAILLFGVVGLHIDTGSGSQVGYVSAVETNGWIFKTTRVYIKPDMASTQEDQYCLVDKSLIEKLNEMAVNKSKIQIEYFSWMFPGITNCKGEEAIIRGVEVK